MTQAHPVVFEPSLFFVGIGGENSGGEGIKVSAGGDIKDSGGGDIKVSGDVPLPALTIAVGEGGEDTLESPPPPSASQPPAVTAEGGGDMPSYPSTTHPSADPTFLSPPSSAELMQLVRNLQAENAALQARLEQQDTPSVAAGAVASGAVAGAASLGKCVDFSVSVIYLFFTHLISNLEAQSDESSDDESSDESCIGKRVAKFFVNKNEDRYFWGTVIEFDPELKFFIKYDDDDVEHVDLSALKNMMDLYDVYKEDAECAEKDIEFILWEAAKKAFTQYGREVVISLDEFVPKVLAVNNITMLTASRIKLIKGYLARCHEG
jgi:hypothetical protein